MVSPDGPGAAIMPTPHYIYRAALVAAHDADTQTYVLDLGFNVRVRVNIRILGINAPELATPAGQAAQRFALSWLMGAGSAEWPLIIASYKAATPIGPDKYGGRFDALVWRVSDSGELGATLIAAGMAAAWSGQGPKPVPVPVLPTGGPG